MNIEKTSTHFGIAFASEAAQKRPAEEDAVENPSMVKARRRIEDLRLSKVSKFDALLEF